MLGSSITWIAPSGAPAALAASASTRAASLQQALACGWGERMMALRVISASSVLKKTVATGLVTGISAKITPAGRGSSTIFFAVSIRGLMKSSLP